MPEERLSMRRIREVCRLKWDLGISDRAIGRSLGMGRGTVQTYVQRSRMAGLKWPLPEALGDEDLEELLFPVQAVKGEREIPDWAEVHLELKRKKKTKVTLWLLWQEYRERNPDGYGYSRFCDLYRKWEGTIDVEMRQEYRAGEKLFVDYAGMTVAIVDRQTGEVREAQVFVGSSGASNYIFAEATWTQTLPDWIGSHSRMFEFMGGMHEILVPDQMKSAVTKACRYDPESNRTYAEMAEHYGIAVIPARPAEPQDKAKVEEAVQCVERECLAPLRHRTFFSLAELNEAIKDRRRVLNDRPFKKLDGCRRSVFEQIERPVLRPLPERPYAYAEWKAARVNVDYHVEVDRHYYSVPYQLVRESVWVRKTSGVIEIFHRGQRVVSHMRSFVRGGYTTLSEHMPKNHQEYKDWSPQRLIRWAQSNGPQTSALVEKILATRVHPTQGYRACLGIMRLGTPYGGKRLEAACGRALRTGCLSYRSVESILKTGLDRLQSAQQTLPEPPIDHEHLRGADYYDTSKIDSV